jgi:hypothetical protein
MANPLTILFLHHRSDDVTHRRLQRLETLNPGVPIVRLTYGSRDVLPGTFDAASLPEFAGEHGWQGNDLALYAWYRHRRDERTDADRYVVAEWDMLYRVSMADFYRETWNEDAVGAQVFYCGPHWHWDWFAKCLPRLPAEMRTFAAGLAPLAGAMLSNRALAAIAQGVIPRSVFCECRIATLAAYHGFDMVELPYAKKRNITWRQDFVRMDKDTLAYHPVKQLTSLDDELLPAYP